MSQHKVKIEEAKKLLLEIGLPLGVDELRTSRRQVRLALALLAVANLKPDTPWPEACIHDDENNHALSTREIIDFWNKHYEENVSSGSYDDVRRKDLIWLIEAGIVLRSATNPDASTNDPTRKYAIAPDARDVIHLYEKDGWSDAVTDFRDKKGDLKIKLERQRSKAMLPVTLPGGEAIKLSPDPHNEIQKAIIEKFLPRDGFDAEVLYIGDTTEKQLYRHDDRLKELGFFELEHDTLPDIVAFNRDRNWLYLIEAVHSSNPMSKLRHMKLERLTEQCTAPRIYISAFLDRLSFREWVIDISWETEVWIAESPDHIIHFDGDKFLGPYEPGQED